MIPTHHVALLRHGSPQAPPRPFQTNHNRQGPHARRVFVFAVRVGNHEPTHPTALWREAQIAPPQVARAPSIRLLSVEWVGEHEHNCPMAFWREARIAPPQVAGGADHFPRCAHTISRSGFLRKPVLESALQAPKRRNKMQKKGTVCTKSGAFSAN